MTSSRKLVNGGVLNFRDTRYQPESLLLVRHFANTTDSIDAAPLSQQVDLCGRFEAATAVLVELIVIGSSQRVHSPLAQHLPEKLLGLHCNAHIPMLNTLK